MSVTSSRLKRSVARHCLPILIAVLLLWASAASRGYAFGTAPVRNGSPPPPPGLTLTVSPPIVDVGGRGTFTLSALSWREGASVVLTIVSAHHGFNGPMVWIGQCGCFKLDVALARRIHPLESARATATVSYPGATYTVVSNFQIRGLAGNGRDFAPGGAAYLATWVSVPRPVDGDTQHFCAWLRTLDDLGIPGVRVRFVVHYRTGAQHWTSVKTNAAGIVCSLRSVGNAAPGVRVFVDAYALGKHARGSFTPRSAG